MDHFLPSDQNFTQNFARNSKIWVKNIWPKNDKKYAHFRPLKSILEFNDNIGYFDMFQGFKKVDPYGGARKLGLTQLPVRRALYNIKIYAHIRIFS